MSAADFEQHSDFWNALDEAVTARQGKPEGREIVFLCPAHADHSPSARWHSEKHVWNCFVCGGGGGAFDLAKRLGVELPSGGRGLGLDELAAYVGLPAEFLCSVGVSEGVAGVERTRCVDIAYTDEDGELRGVRKRLRLNGEPRMVWRRGDHVLPYGLARLVSARDAGYVILVEGESDAWTAWHGKVPAVGLPGASTWKEAWKFHFHDIPRMYLWREPDAGGDTFAEKIGQDFPDVRIVEPPAGLKDLSALWHASGHDRDAFTERLSRLLANARPASQLRDEVLSAEARTLLERCRPLLHDPQLLRRVQDAIRDRGYVGDLTAPSMVYLALTSRLLERPLNVACVAPSSAGKNRAVDAATDLMPSEAFFLEKAGSARALIYSEESFEHRAVIVAEADSIPQDDGPAASAIRSLAEDGYMTYDVVQQDPGTGNFVTRRVVKQGPTALITTSTKPLREQMNTRTLTVTINDSPEQTREVLRSHAASVNGSRPEFDVSDLVDLQRWLTLAGDRQVTIPYGHVLAELVPVAHVRMRRDFRQLLTVIQAVALLYQCQRERAADGRIMATLEDYRLARELILGAFTTAATDGVTPPVREVVEALVTVFDETGKACTRKALADALGIAPRTAGDRLARAVSLGYAVNLETRERQPGQYQPGEPLPENRPPLPTVDELYEHMCVALPEAAHHPATPNSPQVQSEPKASVADTVASDFATPAATLDGPLSDSEVASSGLAWRRGVADQAEVHTSLNAWSDNGRMVGDVDTVQQRDAQLALFGADQPAADGRERIEVSSSQNGPTTDEDPTAAIPSAGAFRDCPSCGARPAPPDALCFRCEAEGKE